jgi:hypothetical protein
MILTTVNETEFVAWSSVFGKIRREANRRYKDAQRILNTGVVTKVYALFENQPERDRDTGRLYRPYDPAPTPDQFIQMCLRFLRSDTRDRQSGGLGDYGCWRTAGAGHSVIARTWQASW